MFGKKLAYKLEKFFKIFHLPKINLGSMFISFVFLAFIVIMSVNIYNTFTNGVETIESFREEQTKLDALIEVNEDLKNQVEHYSSLEYKKIYARENLNLGDTNERLYYVDRPDENLIIEELPQQEVQITFKDNISYWKKLILNL